MKLSIKKISKHKYKYKILNKPGMFRLTNIDTWIAQDRRSLA